MTGDRDQPDPGLSLLSAAHLLQLGPHLLWGGLHVCPLPVVRWLPTVAYDHRTEKVSAWAPTYMQLGCTPNVHQLLKRWGVVIHKLATGQPAADYQASAYTCLPPCLEIYQGQQGFLQQHESLGRACQDSYGKLWYMPLQLRGSSYSA